MTNNEAYVAPPEVVEGYPDTIVDDMADLYESNVIDKTYISHEVMHELADLFNTCPIELRAYTFRAFKEELDRRGLKYDNTAFRGDA